MAEKSLNMMGKMMYPNIIDYYMINCAIPSLITIENRYQIDFGKPNQPFTALVPEKIITICSMLSRLMSLAID